MVWHWKGFGVPDFPPRLDWWLSHLATFIHGMRQSWSCFCGQAFKSGHGRGDKVLPPPPNDKCILGQPEAEGAMWRPWARYAFCPSSCPGGARVAHVHKFVPKRQPGRPRKGREGKGKGEKIKLFTTIYSTHRARLLISSLWRLGTEHVAARA
jgi:hypothetical protein